MSEAEILEKQLGVDPYHLDVTCDEHGRLVRLEIFDYEYYYFTWQGDLMQVLSQFTELKSLEINVSEYVITSLDGLTRLNKLEYLDLNSSCRVSDLSPVKNLSRLKTLVMHNAGVSDISALEGMTQLERLYFTGNNNISLDSLSALTNLTALEISGNHLADISALKPLTKLNYLWMSDNDLTDLSPISELTALQSLNFLRNKVSDISVLQNLSALKQLYMGENPIADPSPVAGLTDVESLQIARIPPMDNLSLLKNMPKLQSLNAGNITNFNSDDITHLTELSHLNLENCGISDLNFVTGFKKLYCLYLVNNCVEDTDPLIGHPKLKSLGLQYNKISKPLNVNLITSLNMVDLTGNSFGNRCYNDLINGYGDAGKYSEDEALYWYRVGEYDKALGYYYTNKLDKISLLIYYDKLIDTDPDDDYFCLYYMIRCEECLRHIKEPDEEVGSIRDGLIRIIEQSVFFDRYNTFIRLRGDSKPVIYYNYNAEYGAYLHSDKPVKPNPEMLHRLATQTFGRKDHLEKLLSIYKQLLQMDSPFHFSLYRFIRTIFRNNFAATVEARADLAHYQDLLENILERHIPFFDTAEWFKTYAEEERARAEAKKAKELQESLSGNKANTNKTRAYPSPREESIPQNHYEWKITIGMIVIGLAILFLLKQCS